MRQGSHAQQARSGHETAAHKHSAVTCGVCVREQLAQNLLQSRVLRLPRCGVGVRAERLAHALGADGQQAAQ
jgi:hypothetical protein